MSEFTEVTFDVIAISAAAVLATDGRNKGWIPKVNILEFTGVEPPIMEIGKSYTVSMRVWFAEKEGWV